MSLTRKAKSLLSHMSSSCPSGCAFFLTRNSKEALHVEHSFTLEFTKPSLHPNTPAFPELAQTLSGQRININSNFGEGKGQNCTKDTEGGGLVYATDLIATQQLRSWPDFKTTDDHLSGLSPLPLDDI